MEYEPSIIRAALETEIDGYRFFLDAAEKATHPRARSTWLGLAGDEIEHMRLLQGNLSALARTNEWEAPDDDSEASTLVKAPIGPTRSLPEGAEHKGDIEALREGLKVEESTYRFYEQAVQRSQHPTGKKTYEALARMEMGHYRLIEETIQLLSDPEQWQLRESRPISEG
jgi:rubrerythrin